MFQNESSLHQAGSQPIERWDMMRYDLLLWHYTCLDVSVPAGLWLLFGITSDNRYPGSKIVVAWSEHSSPRLVQIYSECIKHEFRLAVNTKYRFSFTPIPLKKKKNLGRSSLHGFRVPWFCPCVFQFIVSDTKKVRFHPINRDKRVENNTCTYQHKHSELSLPSAKLPKTDTFFKNVPELSWVVFFLPETVVPS